MCRKLFNIVCVWGGGEPAMPTSILVEGYCKNVHTSMHAHTHQCTYEKKMYMLLNAHTPMHACTHIFMHACTCRYIKTFMYLHSYMKIKASALYDLEFRESDVSPGRTEVKQGKFV